MLKRQPIFPNVIEINYQAGHVIGSNVYLVYDGDQWLLIDIGYADTVEEIIELIREMDFPLSQCKIIVATHADVDHIQGLPKAKQMLRTTVTAHPVAAAALCRGDRLFRFAEIPAQGIDMELPPVEVEQKINEGDRLRDRQAGTGGLAHARAHQLPTLLPPGRLAVQRRQHVPRWLRRAIDAHHGSDLPAFVRSLQRIRASDVQWLLPSHGPYFRKDDRLLDAVITRLQRYQHMADFGTCAAEWPLMDQWEQELAAGKRPN